MRKVKPKVSYSRKEANCKIYIAILIKVDLEIQTKGKAGNEEEVRCSDLYIGRKKSEHFILN